MTHLNELQRREYLQALGIAQYVPRWILSGAKPSAALVLPMELPEEKVSQQVAEPLVVEAPSAPVVAPPRPETVEKVGTVVTGLMASLAPARAGATEPLKVAAANASESVPPFVLSFWRPSARLMVLDARSNQPLPTQTLLHNILRAKGVEPTDTAPELQRWPPMAGQSTGTWSDVQEMTQSFLLGRLELQPAAYLWLMGENAYRAVVADGKPYSEALGQAINLASFGVLALVLPSLSDMLQQPQLKAITWSAIRPHHVR